MSRIKKKRSISPYLLVIISFAVVIFVGSILLVMPFSQQSGRWAFNDKQTGISYIDCLFTAFSATCVTGLCTFKTGIGGSLTFTGQLIVLAMIQIGGLGFITVLTFVITLFKSKLQFKNRKFLSQALNSTNIANVVKFVRKIVLISMIFELIGFAMGLPVAFILYPHNSGKALWTALFTSISAFNNAGFDTFGADSLILNGTSVMSTLKATHAWAYYYYLSYIMILVVMGGLSFLVIIEVCSFKKKPRQWSPFTKIVLSTNLFLLLAGFGLFYVTEGIKGGEYQITTFDALFQSVTCRTAGFASFDQSTLTTGGKVVSCVLMFIGGSPLSTAGGIKTTTIFIIVLAMSSSLRGRPVVAFNRSYHSKTVLKGMTLMMLAFSGIVIALISFSLFERNNPLVNTDNSFFEVFSAFGTVGLSANLTPTLSVGSKIVLCILMFLGRLGPMTFFQVFNDDEKIGHFEYVEADFLIG